MSKSNQNLYRKFRVHKVVVPRHILFDTGEYLKKHGNMGHEGMVLWAGIRPGKNKAIVKSCIHPQQYCTPVSFDVPLDESQRINILLQQKKQVIIAQVHSHPSIAFHSSIDDQFPVTFIIGLFSIVVPEFCQKGLANFSGCEIWEHIGLGRWQRLKMQEIKERFFIIE